MALRATSGPTLVKNAAAVGAQVAVAAKVENSGGDDALVSLCAELGDATLSFEPASATVPGKSRKVLSFAWTAVLPPEKPAHTYRGKLILREVGTGRIVGESALDLYVSRG